MILVSTQPKSFKMYNDIVEKQFLLYMSKLGRDLGRLKTNW